MSEIRCSICHGDVEAMGHQAGLVWFRCQNCGAEQSEDAGSVIGVEEHEGDWNYVE